MAKLNRCYSLAPRGDKFAPAYYVVLEKKRDKNGHNHCVVEWHFVDDE